MSRVVVDASALSAVIFGESQGLRIAERLEGATLMAPTLLKYELINVAWKKARRGPAKPAHLFAALNSALTRYPILWRDVDAADVALVAMATGLSTCDASYLWLAGYYGADLVTLDDRLARVAT